MTYRRHFTQSRLREGLRHSTPISSSQRLCVSLISPLSPKSLPHNLFADPHPLTPIASIFYKKGGGRRGTSKFRSLFPLPRYARKSNQIISFADPHPLTRLESYRFRNIGGHHFGSRVFLSLLSATLMRCLVSVANTGLMTMLSSLNATLTKKQGGRGCYG